jgi:hypothetical protein
MNMTKLNNDIRELDINELETVTGAGAIVDAMHYAQAVAAVVVIYSRPAVEVDTACGK